MDTVSRRLRGLWQQIACCALTLLAFLATQTTDCWACRTPVYRYAMYNWPAAPGYVFYFHYGQPRQEDEQVNQSIRAMLHDKRPANVVLQEIDASGEDGLRQLPKVVASDFRKHSDGKSPMYLVYTPWGVKLFAGQLDPTTVRAMFESPARQRLGELLHQGHACVWIVLSGSDTQAAEQAAKTAQEVAEAVAAGKILADLLTDDDDPALVPSFPTQPAVPASKAIPQQSPDEPSANQAEAAVPAEPDRPAGNRPRLTAGVLSVSRDDPAESWLVRTLLSVEPDLNQYQKEPMAFPVFGRGRVLLPFVGKGITAENLTDCLAYVAGPCSCQVKDENPGFDLLMRWDWEATADALAADQGEQSRGRDVAYMEIDPAQGGPSAKLTGDGAQQAAGHAEPLAAGPLPDNTTRAGQLPQCCQDAAVAPATGNLDHSGHTSLPGVCCYGDAGSFQNRLWLTVGLVLTGAVLAVLLIGTVVLRRSS